MVQLENRHWNEVEHTLFMMPYVGHLVVHALSGERLSNEELRAAAEELTESGATGIHSIELDTDSELPRLLTSARVEAFSDTDAMRLLCVAGLETWISAGMDTEDLEFVQAHLVYEPELEADKQVDPTTDITDERYHVHDMDLPELDVFGKLMSIEPRTIFLKARNA